MIENKKKSIRAAKIDYSNSDLFQLFEFLRVNFVTLATCILGGIIAGVAVFTYLPYKWEAEVTLQIGKVPFLQTFDYIEPPEQAVEKIRSPLFLSTMAVPMYGKPALPNSPTSELLYRDLRASAVKGSGLVSLRVFGWTPQEAYQAAGVLGDKVVDQYRKMSEPYLMNIKRRLAEVTDDLTTSRKVLSNVHALEKFEPAHTESNALLKLAMIDSKATEIQKLQTEQSRLQTLLATANLQETKLVGRSLLPQAPVSPGRGLLILAGAFIGAMAGLFISLVRTVQRSS